jgi:hypothetical protein
VIETGYQRFCEACQPTTKIGAEMSGLAMSKVI